MLETRRAPAPSRASRIRTLALPLIVLFGITLLLYWKLVFTKEYTWINAPDYVNQVVPWFQFQAKEWHAHRFPLWDPYHWCGQPLVGQAQPGAVYPLNWILFLLPLDHGHISVKYLNWYQVAIHFMAVLFAYLLCREMGCSNRASVLGACAFAFGGFFASTDWPQMLNGALWAPVSLLFFLRARRGSRPLLNSAVSGACVGVAFLSGHHQAPMFLLLLMSGLWLHAFLSAGRAEARTLAAMASLFFVFAFLLGAAQILPAVEYGKIALRWVNAKDPVGWKDKVPYYVHWKYSTNPVGILGVAIPGMYTSFDPFVGPTILVLAIGGAITCWANRLVRMIAAAGGAALLFSLGSYSPFQGFLYAIVPDLDKARSPAAAVFLFQLAAGVLAAFGCDSLIRSASLRANPDGRWRGLAWCCLGFAGLVYGVLFAIGMAQGAPVFRQARTGIIALTALALGGLIFAVLRNALSAAAAGTLLLALVLIDVSNAVGYPWASTEEGWKHVDTMNSAADIVRFLRAQPGDFRVWINRADLEVNLGDWEGIQQYNGYNGVTVNLFRAGAYPQLRALLGERYYIARKPLVSTDIETFRDSSGLIVYTRSELEPRVWTVHDTVRADNMVELYKQLDHTLPELKSRAIVTGAAPRLDSCAGADQVRSVAEGQAGVIVKLQMACKGMLILADTFTPGWSASIDGQPARIYETYGAVRGVVVPAGEHRVDFRYRPMSVFLGAGLTGFGALLLAGMWAFARLKA